jgi:hypothetical protein
VDEEGRKRLASGDRSGLAFAYRWPWATGEVVDLMGDDIWEEVEGAEGCEKKKATLDDLIVEGKLAPYKDLPPMMMEGIRTTMD